MTDMRTGWGSPWWTSPYLLGPLSFDASVDSQAQAEQQRQAGYGNVDRFDGVTRGQPTPEMMRQMMLLYLLMSGGLDPMTALMLFQALNGGQFGYRGGTGPAASPDARWQPAPSGMVPGTNGAPPTYNSTTAPPVIPGGATPYAGGRSPSEIHMNQFAADPNGSNANCGPTSLAMALRLVGLDVPGASNNFDRINIARRLMFSGSSERDLARDGVDGNGNRVDSEHSTYSNVDDIIRGARASGADASRISPVNGSIAAAIAQDLRAGNSVVAAGNGSFNQDGSVRNSYGHFVTVSGITEDGNFIVNDPTNSGPVTVTPQQLESWMAGQGNAAVSIKNKNRTSTSTTTSPSTTTTTTVRAGTVRASRGGAIRV